MLLFILKLKMTSFINSATALRKTSGLGPMMMMQTDTGVGQMVQSGCLQPGPGWNILGTGGSSSVATCLLWVAPWGEGLILVGNGTLSCAP